MKVKEKYNLKAIMKAKKIASDFLLIAEEDGIKEHFVDSGGEELSVDEINDTQEALDVIVSKTRQFIRELNPLYKDFAKKN